MPATNPFREALSRLARQQPVGADLSSSQWADVPQALRERALFSARVTNARHLQAILDSVTAIVNPQQVRRADRVTPENPEGFVTVGKDVATARAELKDLLQRMGYNPGEKAGTIQDLGSDARIDLQLKTNVEMTQGFGAFLQGQQAGAIDAFPAQELYRAEDREEPRSWPTRWMQCGGQTFNGRMIALKNDPVWAALGDQTRFKDALGNPFPPFAFGSGMWVRDIARDEAIALGLMTEATVVQPMAAVEQYNARLEASTANLAPELVASLQRSFGSQIVMDGETLKWRNAA